MFLAEIYANKWVKLVLLAAGLFAVGWLFRELSSILGALTVALLLAYITDPFVDFFERWMPRTPAVGVVALLILLVLTLFFVVLVPLFVTEIGELAAGLPEGFKRLMGEISPRLDGLLGRFGYQMPTADQIIDYARLHVPALKGVAGQVSAPVWDALRSMFGSLADSVVGMLNLIIVPVAWIYLVRDFDRMRDRLAGLVPPRHRPVVTRYTGRIHEVIQNFLQGQIIVVMILGLIYGIGLQFIARIPLGFALGILAGALSFIPYMGLILGIVPALLLALLAHGDWQHPLLVVAVFTVAQLLEGNLITPKIQGDKLGLHPVTVIFSLLIFGQLFGLVGLIVAVPITAVILVFLQEGLEAYMASAFFGADAGGPRASSG